jgi:hypothetical protein
MKYDIFVLQVLQKTLENMKIKDRLFQSGICQELAIQTPINSKWIMEWIRNKYMPHKDPKKYWWPVTLSHTDEELKQAQKDRIAFLERIIEDLMCGE